ncbi:MAG: helix-turn-helix transcriptional regulator [Pseudomonadota bacterium]
MNGRELVAWNVKRIRVEKGVSQERLAFDAGVDRSYLGGLERAVANPTVDVLQRIADTLTVPLASFFIEPRANEEEPSSLKAGRRPKRK